MTTHVDLPAQPSVPIRATLQLEGAGIAALCVWAYAHLDGGWGLFALLILVPDLFMLGYLAGNRVGALCYNIGHSYISPLLLAALSWGADAQTGILIALIWGVHIGADRAIGYGLKYVTHFKATHLAKV